MTTIVQSPAELDLTGVSGDPFGMVLDIALTDALGSAIPWSAFTNPSVEVVVRGAVDAALAPTVTSPSDGKLSVAWSAAQTAAIGGWKTLSWALSATIEGVGPETLVAGTLTFNPPTQPGPSGPASANLAVSVGTATASLVVTLGSAGVQQLTAADGTITVGGTATDVTVKVTPNVFDAFGAAAAAQAAAEAASDPVGSASAAQTAAEAASDPVGTAAAVQANLAAETSRATAAEGQRWKTRGIWTGPGTVFAVNDVVDGPTGFTGGIYRCITAHTSGASFSGPGANWETVRDPLGTYVAPAGKTTSGAAAPLPWFHADDYGAVANALQASDGTIGAGNLGQFSSVLAGTFGGFNSTHVGAYIRIASAGPASANLVTTIASVVNATTVTLTTPASQAVTNAFWVAGTDSTAFIQAAVNAAGGGVGGVLGGSAALKGRYLISSPIVWTQAVTVQLGLPAPSLIGLGDSGRIGDNSDIGANALICAPFPSWTAAGQFALDWTSGNTGTSGPLLGVKIENLDVICNSQAAGVRIAGCRKGRIRNVNVDHSVTPAPTVAFAGSTGAICFAQNGNANGAYDNQIVECSVNVANQDGIVMNDNSEGAIRSSFVIAAARYNYYLGQSCKGYDLETTESGVADVWMTSLGALLDGLHYFPSTGPYASKQSNIIISGDTNATTPLGAAIVKGCDLRGTTGTGLTTQQAAMIQLVTGTGKMNAVLSSISFEAAADTSCFIWAQSTLTGQVKLVGDNYAGTPTVAPYVLNGSAVVIDTPARTGGLLLANEGLLIPTGWLVETFSRGRATSNVGNLASQRFQMQAVALPAGLPVGKIGFVSGTIALAGGTNQWFALFDQSRNLLAVTTDDTSTAWAASTLKSLNIATVASGAASLFITQYTGLYYVAVMVNATTVPNVLGCTLGISGISSIAPVYEGHSGGGITTPPAFPFTAAAIGSDGHPLYALLG